MRVYIFYWFLSGFLSVFRLTQDSGGVLFIVYVVEVIVFVCFFLFY